MSFFGIPGGIGGLGGEGGASSTVSTLRAAVEQTLSAGRVLFLQGWGLAKTNDAQPPFGHDPQYEVKQGCSFPVDLLWECEQASNRFPEA